MVLLVQINMYYTVLFKVMFRDTIIKCVKSTIIVKEMFLFTSSNYMIS